MQAFLLMDRLKAVTIRICDEGRVVGRPVVRPEAGSASIGASVRHRGSMERVDRGPVPGIESQVKSWAGRARIVMRE